MDAEPEPDVIREDIEETRSALAEKLETLESQVRDTVEGAKETVQETIENVTSTVQDTVESVQQTFDVNYQMQRRPWAMMFGSVATGFLVGYLVSRQRGFGSRDEPSYTGYGYGGTSSEATSRGERAASELRASQPDSTGYEPQRPGMVSKLYQQFEPELNQVKEMAIGFVAGLARDMLKEAIPALGEQVQRVMDSATRKMGGEPVQGPVTAGMPSHEGEASPAHSGPHYGGRSY
jgi:ElaB/YqjD/DUF883 family membrane-anchored ribosome-binding protein